MAKRKKGLMKEIEKGYGRDNKGWLTFNGKTLFNLSKKKEEINKNGMA